MFNDYDSRSKSSRFGKTEVAVERIIAICPQKRWILFESVYWDLGQADFDKVAEAWKKVFNK